MVGNNIYDRASGKEFSIYSFGHPGDNGAELMWWDKHVPLWTDLTNMGNLTLTGFPRKKQVLLQASGQLSTTFPVVMFLLTLMVVWFCQRSAFLTITRIPLRYLSHATYLQKEY